MRTAVVVQFDDPLSIIKKSPETSLHPHMHSRSPEGLSTPWRRFGTNGHYYVSSGCLAEAYSPGVTPRPASRSAGQWSCALGVPSLSLQPFWYLPQIPEWRIPAAAQLGDRPGSTGGQHLIFNKCKRPSYRSVSGIQAFAAALCNSQIKDQGPLSGQLLE